MLVLAAMLGALPRLRAGHPARRLRRGRAHPPGAARRRPGEPRRGPGPRRGHRLRLPRTGLLRRHRHRVRPRRPAGRRPPPAAGARLPRPVPRGAGAAAVRARPARVRPPRPCGAHAVRLDVPAPRGRPHHHRTGRPGHHHREAAALVGAAMVCPCSPSPWSRSDSAPPRGRRRPTGARRRARESSESGDTHGPVGARTAPRGRHGPEACTALCGSAYWTRQRRTVTGPGPHRNHPTATPTAPAPPGRPGQNPAAPARPGSSARTAGPGHRAGGVRPRRGHPAPRAAARGTMEAAGAAGPPAQGPHPPRTPPPPRDPGPSGGTGDAGTPGRRPLGPRTGHRPYRRADDEEAPSGRIRRTGQGIARRARPASTTSTTGPTPRLLRPAGTARLRDPPARPGRLPPHRRRAGRPARRRPRAPRRAGPVLLVRHQRGAAEPRRHPGRAVRPLHAPAAAELTTEELAARQGVLRPAPPPGRPPRHRAGHRRESRRLRPGGRPARRGLHRQPGSGSARHRVERRTGRRRADHPHRRRQLRHPEDVRRAAVPHPAPPGVGERFRAAHRAVRGGRRDPRRPRAAHRLRRHAHLPAARASRTPPSRSSRWRRCGPSERTRAGRRRPAASTRCCTSPADRARHAARPDGPGRHTCRARPPGILRPTCGAPAAYTRCRATLRARGRWSVWPQSHASASWAPRT